MDNVITDITEEDIKQALNVSAFTEEELAALIEEQILLVVGKDWPALSIGSLMLAEGDNIETSIDHMIQILYQFALIRLAILGDARLQYSEGILKALKPDEQWKGNGHIKHAEAVLKLASQLQAES